jgi:hypothetical protein
MASGSHGFVAQGSARFVAAAALGAAIGDAISNHFKYEDCMRASGWHVVDSSGPDAQSAPPVQQAVANEPPTIAAATHYPVTALSVDRRLQIILPLGWTQLDGQPSGSGKLTNNTILAHNNQIDADFAVFAFPKGVEASDVQSVYLRVRPAIMPDSPGNTETAAIPITLEGHPAIQWDVSVMTPTGPKQGLMTVVDTGSYVCLVAAVTMADQFAGSRSEFESMRRTLTELNNQANLVR